jgi:hypothetical protein
VETCLSALTLRVSNCRLQRTRQLVHNARHFWASHQVEWDRSSPLTPFGHLVYFVESLKVSGRLDALIADCPFAYWKANVTPAAALDTAEK